MDHKVSKDMISSGMTPSGEKTQADLGRTQYGSAPSPSRLMDAYHSMYQTQKEETLEEHHQKDKNGNTIPHEDEELNEGKIPAGLQAYLDKKKGKKEDKEGKKEDVKEYAALATGALKMLGAKKAAAVVAKKGIMKSTALAADRAKNVAVKKVKDIAQNPVVQSQAISAMSSGGQQKKQTTGTVSASADLFDIVKGKLIDEGLNEKEIKDIMLTLTPDEILNEISVGKMADYISAADKDVQKTATDIQKGKSVMGDDPRVKKMSKRAEGMAMAGTKIAKKLTPPSMP